MIRRLPSLYPDSGPSLEEPDYGDEVEYNEAEELWGDTPQALGLVPATAEEVAEKSIDEVDA